MFSTDGRWIAYVSDESSGRGLRATVPWAGGKRQMSTEVGTEPLWAPSGRELFYRIDNKMMASRVMYYGAELTSGHRCVSRNVKHYAI